MWTESNACLTPGVLSMVELSNSESFIITSNANLSF